MGQVSEMSSAKRSVCLFFSTLAVSSVEGPISDEVSRCQMAFSTDTAKSLATHGLEERRRRFSRTHVHRETWGKNITLVIMTIG